MGDINFDRNLRMKLGAEQYRRNKSKAGASGSSAGQPRPYARKNIAKARLSSPILVGRDVIITPKKNFSTFRVGKLYTWHVSEPGFGDVNGHEFLANDIDELFIVRRKNEKIENLIS